MINDDTLPAFETGMVGNDMNVGYPSVPSRSALRTGTMSAPQQHFYINAQGAILASDLLDQMKQIGTVTLAAAPLVTRQEFGEQAMQNIPV